MARASRRLWPLLVLALGPSCATGVEIEDLRSGSGGEAGAEGGEGAQPGSGAGGTSAGGTGNAAGGAGNAASSGGAGAGSSGEGGTSGGGAASGGAGAATGGTSGSGGTPCIVGQKRCAGLCVPIGPSYGCSPVDGECGACSLPTGAVSPRCEAGACAFDCGAGYQKSGSTCVPAGTGGSSGSGAGGFSGSSGSGAGGFSGSSGSGAGGSSGSGAGGSSGSSGSGAGGSGGACPFPCISGQPLDPLCLFGCATQQKVGVCLNNCCTCL